MMADASSGAAFIHSFYVWNLACEARDRARDLAARDPTRSVNDATAALLLAAAAIEGFINEVMDISRLRTMPTEVAERVGYERYVAACRIVESIERSRGQTELKYMMASQVLSGRMFDRGSAPLQDVTTLFDLRNMVMHLKPVPQDVKIIKTPDGDRIWSEMPPKIRTLQTRGLARDNDKGSSWFSVLQTYEMAAWACETAREIMRATISMLPLGFHRNIFTDMIERAEARSRQDES
jgi:hypothetical protein